MKYNLRNTITIFLFGAGLVFSQKPDAKKSLEVLETNYFSFKSNPSLNAHLFLYNKAMGCKFKKVHNDSLAYYSFKEKIKSIPPKDLMALNSVVEFYRDSLVGKDLLFDSLMRDFSDKLSRSNTVTTNWQNTALNKLNVFSPYFVKLFWPTIEAENKAWFKSAKTELARLETVVIPELERIYQTKLPAEKITIDLVNYATWTGAYSYNDTYCHVIFSSTHHSNKGELAAEVVFHETSHFLVDKLEQLIKLAAKGKNVKQNINLWHNMIFYTTGYVLERQYMKEAKTFTPYYVQMKFEEKFPDFKTSVEACKLHWNPYCEEKIKLEESVKNIVGYISEKK